jgi:hypothetical protein
MDRYILDDDGNPIRETEYSLWDAWMSLERFKSCILAKNIIGDAAAVVTTVFTGLDYSFAGGPPLLYQSTLFRADMRGEVTRRYPTKLEAMAGHTDLLRYFMEEK